MDDFLLRALLAGLGIAIIAGPLGCFMVWQRMAYFGDTLAHSALLGVALGLWLDVPTLGGMLIVSAMIGLLLVTLLRHPQMASDTILGILSHTALALGLILLSLMQPVGISLTGYLFGDILTTTTEDLLLIAGGGVLVLAVLARLWQPLLLVTLHPELAAAEGLPVKALRLAYVLLLATVIALAMQLVGMLLITALLILPAATGRQLAHTPEQMAALSVSAGMIAVSGGMAGSLALNTPTGPMIIACLAGLFLLTIALQSLKRNYSST